MSDPAAPPKRTYGISSNAPPAASTAWPRVVPDSSSYTPGRATLPDKQNRRVPGESGVPVAAYDAPPSRTMRGTFIRVSTLLTTVGRPNSPATVGNGGFWRGSPRYPSMDANSAVSSPQMYAPC